MKKKFEIELIKSKRILSQKRTVKGYNSRAWWWRACKWIFNLSREIKGLRYRCWNKRKIAAEIKKYKSYVAMSQEGAIQKIIWIQFLTIRGIFMIRNEQTLK